MRAPASLLALFALACPAWAGIEICNDAPTRQTVAIGYEGDGGQWTSEGWWGIDPGTCRTVRGRPLDRPVFYYRAESGNGNFDGPYGFCTTPQAFTIVGDTDCEARGYDRDRFREVALDYAEDFTLTLVAPASATPPPPPPPAARAVGSSYQRGSRGEPFTQRGLFTGCQVIDGADFCGFVADGWRWHAFAGGGTPDSVIDALYGWPINTPVGFAGDILYYGDITVEIVVSEVEEIPGGDAFADLRAILQGDWISETDPRSRFTVSGADVYDYYDGAFEGHHLMQLRPACEGMEGLGTGFVRTTLETQDSWCVIVARATSDRVEFSVPGRGTSIGYVRAR